MAGLVRITLNDGTELEVDAGQPWTAREQIAWEEQFKTSFQTVYRAIGAEAKAYLDAKMEAIAAGASTDFEPDVDVREFRVAWMLWFAWWRLRPRVANRFSTFVDEQLADYAFVQETPPDDQEPAGAPADEESGLDPTVKAEASAQGR